jgi:hypothetical protein
MPRGLDVAARTGLRNGEKPYRFQKLAEIGRSIVFNADRGATASSVGLYGISVCQRQVRAEAKRKEQENVFAVHKLLNAAFTNLPAVLQ